MRSALGVWLASSLLLLACGDGVSGEPEQEQDQAATDAGEMAAEFEGCPESIPTFELGMGVDGNKQRIRAVLREASSVPPARYFNDWSLELTDPDGNPLEDAQVVRARAYMRVHRHYGTPDPKVVQREGEPALFDFERINLFMRGPWELQLTLRSASAGEDDVVLHVCVDE